MGNDVVVEKEQNGNSEQKFRVQPIFYKNLNVNVNKEFGPISFYSILSCPNIIYNNCKDCKIHHNW